ncbi:MAG TPA: RNA polymerase sigma factor [Ktedonobacterales bacterium]|nr:RNA polymerase sigma factor [Ktedonobacterales bacterium]
MPTETNSRAIEGWIASARPRLQRLARLRGVAPDAIEDVVQETLLEAWKHQDRLHTPEGVHLWLDEICRNVCRRHARKRLLEQQRFAALAPNQDDEHEETAPILLANIPDSNTLDPLEALSRQELILLLDRALGLLSGNARQVVELCYLLELPQREAAAQLGLSISALEARLHRARQQLRQMLNGPLREDAEALGLALDAESAGGWRETRLWCALCGQRRLMGLFLPQPNASVNLHMRCPDCEQRFGLSDADNSSVHSKGLVQLEGLQAFRPAWKRTMQGVTQRLMQALHASGRTCPYCGAQASLQLIDKMQAVETIEETTLPTGISRHPYQFWLWWKCSRCEYAATGGAGFFAASDLVYWSHAETQRFMADHPRWRSEPELLVEYAGQPALRFQMADLTSAARLTVLAHRQTLDVLAVF